MTDSTLLQVLGVTLMVIGVTVDVIGCLGLVRMPDVYNRLQAGTKCVTLGTCSILLGAALMSDGVPGTLKALMCMAFVLVTCPTGAHALARSAHAAGIPLSDRTVVDAYGDAKKGDA